MNNKTEGGVAGGGCPHCGAKLVVKNGSSRGRQRYLCKACGRSFGPNTPPKEFAGIRKLNQFKQYIEMAAQHMTLRAIASKIGVSLATAFAWRHKYMESLPEVPEVPLPGRIVLIVSLAARPSLMSVVRAVANGEKNKRMMTSMPEEGLDGGVLAGRALHLVTIDEWGMIRQFTYYVSALRNSFSLDELLRHFVAPGAVVCREAFQFIQPWLDDNQVLPSTGPDPFRDMPLTGEERKWEILKDIIKPDTPNIYWPRYLRNSTELMFSASGQFIKRLYRSWIRSFRGIGHYYLNKYTAWFNVCWRDAAKKLNIPGNRMFILKN